MKPKQTKQPKMTKNFNHQKAKEGFSCTQMVLAAALILAILPSQALSEQLCDAAQKSAFVEANRQSSYNPKLPDGKSYNAKGGWYIYYLVITYIKFKLNTQAPP